MIPPQDMVRLEPDAVILNQLITVVREPREVLRVWTPALCQFARARLAGMVAHATHDHLFVEVQREDAAPLGLDDATSARLCIDGGELRDPDGERRREISEIEIELVAGAAVGRAAGVVFVCQGARILSSGVAPVRRKYPSRVRFLRRGPPARARGFVPAARARFQWRYRGCAVFPPDSRGS